MDPVSRDDLSTDHRREWAVRCHSCDLTCSMHGTGTFRENFSRQRFGIGLRRTTQLDLSNGWATECEGCGLVLYRLATVRPKRQQQSGLIRRHCAVAKQNGEIVTIVSIVNDDELLSRT